MTILTKQMMYDCVNHTMWTDIPKTENFLNRVNSLKAEKKRKRKKKHVTSYRHKFCHSHMWLFSPPKKREHLHFDIFFFSCLFGSSRFSGQYSNEFLLHTLFGY